MTFEEAIRTSIKAFYDGKLPEKLSELQEQVIYTPEFLDEIEQGVLEEKAPKKSKKKDALEEDDE